MDKYISNSFHEFAFGNAIREMVISRQGNMAVSVAVPYLYVSQQIWITHTLMIWFIPEIRIKIQMLDEEALLDVPSNLCQIFNKESCLLQVIRQSYGIELSEPPGRHGPLTLQFQRTEFYDAKKLQRDLLSLKVADLIKEHLHSDDNTNPAKVILDVDLSDIVAGGCDDDSMQQTQHPSAGPSDSGTGELNWKDCDQINRRINSKQQNFYCERYGVTSFYQNYIGSRIHLVNYDLQIIWVLSIPYFSKVCDTFAHVCMAGTPFINID